MTQYTKFTKNINYNENNYSNLQNGGINTPINHQNLTKVASRGSNMTGISTTNGSPALTLNTSNLPKPVLITNLNSSNISSLIKNERIKSSSIARSVTMRYNTNTKLQFDNSPNFSNPNSTTTPNNNNNNQTANHFHYNRRSLQQTQSPPHQQQQQQHHQPLPQQHQQQVQLPLTSTNPNLSSVDTSLSNQQAKKEYLSLLSNIHRSQSIKLNRDKSNLSGFFNGLVNNREKTNNSNFNGGTSSNLANLNSNSNNNNSNNNTNNYLTLNSKFNSNSRKTQPFSLRNNNGSNSGLYNANNTSNNSINLNNSSDINYNNNSNTVSKQISNSNNRLSEISKNSISLDNVYNGLDLIIANEHKYNKIENMTNNNNNNNNTNKSNNSLAYLNSKKSSNTPQIFASTHTHASNNSINFNFGNQNYSIDNSNNRVINELNLLKNKKRAQKLEIDEEITHNSSNINNINNNNNNNNNNDENITKELSSSRSNHLKPNELNENDENNLLNEIEHYNKVASIHQNGVVAGVSMNESSLLKATNYFAKKVKPSKSELRHIKLNDESIYNNKISKLDLIDQLDIYQPKQTTNSINFLKQANKQLAGTSPSINYPHHPHHQLNNNSNTNNNNNTAHSPVNRFKNELQLQQQQQRNLIEYNNKTGSSLMLDSTTQSNKLNHSRSQLTRNHSRLSHITRDVNDSYAYTNVQQYIEENDLMPPEKAHSIKKWIIEVNSNYDDWEKKTVEKHIEDSFV
jgi:hypothetical protein